MPVREWLSYSFEKCLALHSAHYSSLTLWISLSGSKMCDVAVHDQWMSTHYHLYSRALMRHMIDLIAWECWHVEKHETSQEDELYTQFIFLSHLLLRGELILAPFSFSHPLSHCVDRESRHCLPSWEFNWSNVLSHSCRHYRHHSCSHLVDQCTYLWFRSLTSSSLARLGVIHKEKRDESEQHNGWWISAWNTYRRWRFHGGHLL